MRASRSAGAGIVETEREAVHAGGAGLQDAIDHVAETREVADCDLNDVRQLVAAQLWRLVVAIFVARLHRQQGRPHVLLGHAGSIDRGEDCLHRGGSVRPRLIDRCSRKHDHRRRSATSGCTATWPVPDTTIEPSSDEVITCFFAMSLTMTASGRGLVRQEKLAPRATRGGHSPVQGEQRNLEGFGQGNVPSASNGLTFARSSQTRSPRPRYPKTMNRS